MRVLHLPAGRQMTVLCSALRELGVEATSVHFDPESYQFESDICLHLKETKQKDRKLRQFFFQQLDQYDIFHFHFGKTFFPEKSELDLLKKLGKKLVVQHRGSDARRLSIARKHGNSFVRVKSNRTEQSIHNNMTSLSKYIDHAIISDYELLPYVKPYYKYVHVIPHAVRLANYPYAPPSPKEKIPLIVHAPTNPRIKGTDYVLKAIKKLKKKGYRFKYKQIENLPHYKAVKIYRQADIMIDQLLIGSLGVLSIEAMALGKPVVCYVRDEVLKGYPGVPPIVNANPRTLYRNLKKLLNEPTLRTRLGQQGREYVARYHDSKIVARQLADLYKRIS